MTRRSHGSGTYPSVRPEPASAAPLAGTPSSEALVAAVHDAKIGRGPTIRKCGFEIPTFVQYGERLRAARKTLGWSQDYTAKMWGCARLTYASYERGDTLAPVTLLDWLEGLAAEARKVGT